MTQSSSHQPFSQQGETHHLSDRLSLYVTEQGEGTPYLLVPGWAYSSAVFDRCAALAPRDVRLIAYDPRGHGRSPATDSGHSYAQHGEDLHALLTHLDLRDVTLLGWSLGVYDILCYLEAHGVDRVKRLILVDESPTIIKANEESWGEGSEAEVASLVQVVQENFLDFFADYMREGFEGDPTPADVEHFRYLASNLTPSDAAQLLDDAIRYDFTQLLKDLGGSLPLQFIVRKEWAASAERWLSEQGLTDVVMLDVLGAHLMLM